MALLNLMTVNRNCRRTKSDVCTKQTDHPDYDNREDWNRLIVRISNFFESSNVGLLQHLLEYRFQ